MADKHIQIWEICCIEAFIAAPPEQWTGEEDKFLHLHRSSYRDFIAKYKNGWKDQDRQPRGRVNRFLQKKIISFRLCG
jgi:hypothetical protein